MSVTPIQFARTPPSALSQRLRELAQMVDDGKLTNLNAVYVLEDNYTFLYASSLIDGIVMSALLHDNFLQRMRR